VAVVTGVGVIATLFYDFWTALGFWIFMTPRTFEWLAWVLTMQAPFTIYHLMSSLIFVPLFGTIFMYVHEHGIPDIRGIFSPSQDREEKAGEDNY
jgi:hypothetical protein